MPRGQIQKKSPQSEQHQGDEDNQTSPANCALDMPQTRGNKRAAPAWTLYSENEGNLEKLMMHNNF